MECGWEGCKVDGTISFALNYVNTAVNPVVVVVLSVQWRHCRGWILVFSPTTIYKTDGCGVVAQKICLSQSIYLFSTSCPAMSLCSLGMCWQLFALQVEQVVAKQPVRLYSVYFAFSSW